MVLRLIIFALLVSCAAPAPPDSGITRACIRSFAPTLDAWEAAFDRVPDECRYLDAEYDVVLTGELPCDGELGVNETRTGCTRGGAIYLLEGRDELALVDSSVHEWLHALAECVYGDLDADHLRARLWAVYGADSAEVQAQASVEIGECL